MALDRGKKTPVGISCPNDLLAIIDKITKKERRTSRSNTCVMLIELGIEAYKKKFNLE
jgi:metal-responsive CopG/Arc/MetJ family transcriptional regulator